MLTAQSVTDIVTVGVIVGACQGERVMDMCAAPGGKTTYIAQMMRNTGILVANDLKRERIPSLIGNLLRLGVKNAIVTCRDGREIAKAMPGFDRILLDAPCTGMCSARASWSLGHTPAP